MATLESLEEAINAEHQMLKTGIGRVERHLELLNGRVGKAETGIASVEARMPQKGRTIMTKEDCQALRGMTVAHWVALVGPALAVVVGFLLRGKG